MSILCQYAFTKSVFFFEHGFDPPWPIPYHISLTHHKYIERKQVLEVSLWIISYDIVSLKKLILPILNSKFLRNRRIPEYPYVDTPSFSLEDCINPWLYIFVAVHIYCWSYVHTNPWRIIRIHRPTNQPALALRHSRLATGQTTKENYSLSECYKLSTHLTI